MRLIRIGQDLIDPVWQYVKDLLEKPVKLNQGEFDLEDVKQSLIAGDMDLWIAATTSEKVLMAATTQVVVFPKEKRLRIVLVGAKDNRLDEWLDTCLEDGSELLNWCKKKDIKRIESCGRDGWTNVLSKHGFKKYYTVLTRDVS